MTGHGPSGAARSASVLCIGGATIDHTYRLSGPLLPATSNPVASRHGFGGVARNVAETLARLGTRSALLSVVGEDDAGRRLAADLARAGVDASGVVAVPGATTAAYSAVLTPEGELVLGLADMAILDRLTPAVMAGCDAALAEADWVFADCNMTAALLAALAGRTRHGGYRLAVDPVSVAKTERLPDHLAGIDLLILNRDEADAVLARHGNMGFSRPQDAAAALLKAGVGAVVLTLGAHGAIAATPDAIALVPPHRAKVVDVTGAGDSLIAAVLTGLIAGASLAEAVAIGCRAAAITVGSPSAVNPDLRNALG